MASEKSKQEEESNKPSDSGEPNAESISIETETTAEDMKQAQGGDESTAKEASDQATELSAALKQAQDKAEEHWNELLRTKAELENVRKRSKKELENAHKYAIDKFVQELLPVIDSLELGIEAAQTDGVDLAKLREGSELTLKMLLGCSDKFGVEVVNPVGDVFNPEYHQAMSILETSEYKPNTIINVMQKGYRLHDRLIRPAMVVVSKAIAETKPDQSTEFKDNAADDAQKVGNNVDEQA